MASPDPEKARRAARHPDRPGEDCRATPGAFAITVDRGRCEGKGDCVDVCPYGVFEVGRIADADFAKLSRASRTAARPRTHQGSRPARRAGCASWPVPRRR